MALVSLPRREFEHSPHWYYKR